MKTVIVVNGMVMADRASGRPCEHYPRPFTRDDLFTCANYGVDINNVPFAVGVHCLTLCPQSFKPGHEAETADRYI